MDARNLVSLLELIEHGFNGDRLDLLDQVLAPDVVSHGPVPIEPGREGLKAALGALRAAFPDSHVVIEDLAFAGETIFRRWSFSGTHDGPFGDLPASGRPVALGGVDIDRFQDGLVVEHWSYWNIAELLAQMRAGPA